MHTHDAALCHWPTTDTVDYYGWETDKNARNQRSAGGATCA